MRTLKEPEQRQKPEQGVGIRDWRLVTGETGAKQRHGQLLRTTKCKLWVSRGEPTSLFMSPGGDLATRHRDGDKLKTRQESERERTKFVKRFSSK